VTTTETKSRPIIFSSEMVRAILDGRKTQTRRIVNPQPPVSGRIVVGPYSPVIEDKYGNIEAGPSVFGAYDMDNEWGMKCPYGAPGDRLWVRETWQHVYRRHDGQCFNSMPDAACTHSYEYLATVKDGQHPPRWRSPIRMPREASRITLEITAVRVERLQEITIEDVVKEGLPRGIYSHAKKAFHACDDGMDCQLPDGRVFYFEAAFRELWDSINCKKSSDACWECNPWVWVLEFRRAEP
jgi:hypothetical protein